MTWTFRLSSEEHTRLPNLQRSSSFQQVALDVSASMKVLCCHEDRIKDTPYRRVAYCIDIGQDLFDSFFNSEFGYRAAYFRSPYAGLEVNSLLITALSSRLLDSSARSQTDLDVEFIHESLSTPSAKAWLAEVGKEVCLECPSCQGEWSSGSIKNLTSPEILNGRWETAESVEANWGSKAPYLSKLRVLGAFLDERSNEFVPARKRFRAREIHEQGWS